MKTEKIGETKQIVEMGVQDMPVKDVLWNAQEIETDSVPIIDPGQGSAVVLRHFFFKATPAPNKPTKQQLFSQFRGLIEATLWGDGLVPRYDRNVEVHTRNGAKKVSKTLYNALVKNKADFVIMCLAEPRHGVQLHETPVILK